MEEVKGLEINYLGVDGWEVSGGKSQNVWGQVPTENLPFDEFKKAVRKGRKSCILTCYDEGIYKKDSTGKLIEPDIKNLPKTISATFKPTFTKYSAVAENMAMRIAMVLGMPTSYNYLVKFDAKKYPEIINNFKISGIAENLKPVGVVSIDFLKAEELDTPVKEEKRIKIDGKFEWIETDRNHTGEVLVSFEENINRMKEKESVSGESLLAKNWIRSVEFLASKCAQGSFDLSENGRMKRVKSRVARSFLLREFLGDCDFTDINSGIVVNYEKKYLNYAPNFDYGESFNSLIRTKLDFLPPAKELEVIMKFDKDFIRKKQEQSKIPVEELAKRYSSLVSDKNLEYIVNNFPDDAKEFLDGLNKVIKSKKIDDIVDSYTEMTIDGKPLLTKEDASMFKTYINTRADWIKNIIENKFEKTNMEK